MQRDKVVRLARGPRICVVTGARAEYGLLRPLIRRIHDDPLLHLQLVATGMHLSPEFDNTIDEVEADGFPIADRIEMLLSSDSPTGIAKSMGLGIIGFADALARLQPDVLVVLGDRFEMFAAAQAAMVARIPIAHIHGGEATEGVIDEAIRHAVTKMAHLHFVSAEAHRSRVIQMGEDPKHIYNVGATALDTVADCALMPREAVSRSLGLALDGPTFLITYHAVTLCERPPEAAICELLAALDGFPEARLIFTQTNADTHGRAIQQHIEDYAWHHRERAVAVKTLGQRRYLSAMAAASVVIGNSSSGLVEAPAMGTPTVNIGIRQGGRLRAPSVIDCDEQAGAIRGAINQALSPAFQALAKRRESPYGGPGAAARMIQVLKTTPLDSILLKRFHDVATQVA